MISSSLTCRLPQTPRTTSTGVAHYFDDIFARFQAPKVIHAESLRRSSTNRSIGTRTDFDKDPYKAKAEADFTKYISEQLEKLRVSNSINNLEDEIEA